MFLLVSALMLGTATPASEWPCDPPPRPIVDVGSAATYVRRLEALNSFYARCFGQVTGYDMPISYLASPDGHLRRQREGNPAEVELGLYISYRARGYAVFTLTYPMPKPNGDFCSFALPLWSQADLDRRAEECYDAMTQERVVAEATPRADPLP